MYLSYKLLRHYMQFTGGKKSPFVNVATFTFILHCTVHTRKPLKHLLMQTSQDDDTCAQRLRTMNNVCLLIEQFSYRARQSRLPLYRGYVNLPFFIRDPVPSTRTS